MSEIAAYLMTMITHDLIVNFPWARRVPPRPTSWNRDPDPKWLYLDLRWVRRSGLDFIQHFALAETAEISGMTTLRAKAPLETFLAWHGATLKDALERWPMLKSNYARHFQSADRRAFADIPDVVAFYDEVGRGNRPALVDLAFVEHYFSGTTCRGRVVELSAT